MQKLDAGPVQGLVLERMKERESFRLARHYQAGASVGQRIVDISRVTDELPNAWRHIVQQPLDIGCVECSGGQHAQRAICRSQSGSPYNSQKLAAKEPQRADLQPAGTGSILSEAKRPFRLKRIADGRHITCASGAHQRPEHTRKHVGVLVRVHVGNCDASRLDLTNLRNGFALDLCGFDAAGEEVNHKSVETGAQAATGRKRGKFVRVQFRPPIHEDHMTPDSERRLFEGCMYGIAKGRPRCHQCCGGQGICGIQVEDGAVHAFRQTEIIGIDDEAASYRMRGIHAPSLASD